MNDLDRFDRVYGLLKDVAPMTRPSPVTEALPMAGNVSTWIVQTAMHDSGPIVFLQAVDGGGHVRLVLPSKVVRAIIRQEAALRERMADKRTPARKRADAEREKLAAARKRVADERERRRLNRLRFVSGDGPHTGRHEMEAEAEELLDEQERRRQDGRR